jgi:Family of unknown function (DUF6152)
VPDDAPVYPKIPRGRRRSGTGFCNHYAENGRLTIAGRRSISDKPSIENWISGRPGSWYWLSSIVMERIMTRKALFLAGITAALSAAPALAHHAFAIFDSSKLLVMPGTVKQFELVNPHAWLHLTVVNDTGAESTWSFEGGSVAQLVSLGWKDSFKIGDRILVGFRPMKDGSRGGQLMSVTLASGQKLCSNRGCGDGTGAVLAPF